MRRDEIVKRIIASRAHLVEGLTTPRDRFETEAEGGCGVTGFACCIPVRGKHIFEPSKQMHNRGNGRGGGIAAMGFDPRMLGVSREILDEHYILQIAVLEEGVIDDLERRFIEPWFNVGFSEQHSAHRRLPGHPRAGGPTS